MSYLAALKTGVFDVENSVENCGNRVENSVEKWALGTFPQGFPQSFPQFFTKGSGALNCLSIRLQSAFGGGMPRESLRLLEGVLA